MITDAIMESGTFDYELSRENQVVVKEALNAFKTAQESIKEDTSKTTILDVILPPVLSSLVANYSSEEMPLNNILPSDPEEYRELVEGINRKREERLTFIEKVMDKIRYELRRQHIDAEVTGRAKHLYSIYRKMKRDNKDLDQIYDLFALRILVNSVKDCYSALRSCS